MYLCKNIYTYCIIYLFIYLCGYVSLYFDINYIILITKSHIISQSFSNYIYLINKLIHIFLILFFLRTCLM